MRVFTCDENWNETDFVDRTQRKNSTIHKKLILDNFRIYWNANENNFLHSELEEEQIQLKLKNLIFSDKEEKNCKPTGLNYLLAFSTEGKMIQKNMTQDLIDEGKPEFDIMITLEKCKVDINREQIKQLVDILNVINEYQSLMTKREKKYKSYMIRPERIIRLAETGAEKKEIIREYWKYAKRALIHQANEEKRGIQSVLILSKKGKENIKRRFLEIFDQILSATDPKKVELTELDRRYYESVLLGMNIDEIKTWIEEKIKEKKFREEIQKKIDSQKGYFTGWFGSTVEKQPEISNDEQEEIKNFIEDIVKQTEVNLKIPSNYPKLRLRFFQKQFEINLRKKDVLSQNIEIIKLLTNEISLDLHLKQKGSVLQSSLKSFGVFFLKQNNDEIIYNQPVLYSKTNPKETSKESLDVILKKMSEEHRLLFYNNNLCGKLLNRNENNFSISDKDFDNCRANSSEQTFFTLLLEDCPQDFEGIFDKRYFFNQSVWICMLDLLRLFLSNRLLTF